MHRKDAREKDRGESIRSINLFEVEAIAEASAEKALSMSKHEAYTEYQYSWALYRKRNLFRLGRYVT